MALREVWWMQGPRTSHAAQLYPDQPHRHWPWNQPQATVYKVLEAFLHEEKGSDCSIDVYFLKHCPDRPRWSFHEILHTAKEVIRGLEQQTINDETVT
jgi:hypothetical protein